jgi:hypothetical protein
MKRVMAYGYGNIIFASMEIGKKIDAWRQMILRWGGRCG